MLTKLMLLQQLLTPQQHQRGGLRHYPSQQQSVHYFHQMAGLCSASTSEQIAVKCPHIDIAFYEVSILNTSCCHHTYSRNTFSVDI